MREETNIKTNKFKLLAEIFGCFIMIYLVKAIVFGIADSIQSDSIWWGIAINILTTAAILTYVRFVENKSLTNIGLSRITPQDIGVGLLLGVILFILQQIPLLAMGFEYKQLSAPPNWPHFLILAINILVFVGVSEEIAFRGFILHKSEKLFQSKIIAVIINCLLFYMLHWPPVRFVFGEFFSTSLTTIVLSVYLYRSSKKSIMPLIIAHGAYNVLTSLLPTAIYYIYA